jgi:hypothetical protein
VSTDKSLWLSISALARRKGVRKSAVSKRAARFGREGLIHQRRGPVNSKEVNLEEFERACAQATDEIRAQNGRAAKQRHRVIANPTGERNASSHVVPVDLGAASSDPPTLAKEQVKRAQADAELKRMEVEERRGKLIKVSKVEDALVAAGEKIVRVIDQLPTYAGDLATAVAKGGGPALRVALKDIARRMRTAIADSLSLSDEKA